MDNSKNRNSLLDLFELTTDQVGRTESKEAAASPTRQQNRVVRENKRRKRRRRFFSFSLMVVALLLTAGLGIFVVAPLLGFGGAPDYPGPGEGVVDLEVKEGVSKLEVATVLYNEDVVKSSRAFLDALKDRNEKSRQEVVIKPGHYVFQKQMAAAAVVNIFAERSGEKVIYVPIKAGERLNETLEVLSDTTQIEIGILEDLVRKPQDFGIKARAARNLEGYLAPGNYRFPIGTLGKDIIQQMVDNTLKDLNDAGVSDPEEQYRVLTVASMVEAEGIPRDYAKISGVIENRLRPNNAETRGFLQIDAAVHYGLGVRDTLQLSKEEREDQSNPYNTYANPGLPVGPINSPGTKAIEAAVNPEPSNYYYWVVVNLDTGETKFSESYAEHERNVGELEQWCAENENKCK